MFTGIIETLGTIERIDNVLNNKDFTIASSLSSSLKIDQSVSHNGVCLTVVEIGESFHRVTAIEETLIKSNIGSLQVGDVVNLERCTVAGARLDGHIVQGHVDQVATCISKEDQNGSWLFTFQYDATLQNITVEKGSISVDGISLTVVNSKTDEFSVAIIPYTLDHTNFRNLEPGGTVNLEFDIIGKYVAKLMELRA